MKSLHQTRKQRYYEQTEYPELYKKVYWGNHHGDKDVDILKNRNRFAKEYEIKDVAELKWYVEKRLFDLLYYDQDNNKETNSRITETTINYKNSIYFDDKQHIQYYIDNRLPIIIKRDSNGVKDIMVKKYDTDHNEYYISNKYPRSIIHIFSMYISDDIDHQFIIDSGYKEIYPLYAKDQRTYIMIRPRYKKDENYFIQPH